MKDDQTSARLPSRSVSLDGSSDRSDTDREPGDGLLPPFLSGSTGDRLLVLAAELFREKGYAATTTRELSSRLGLKKASLYHHMKGKEDLLFAISMESLNRISEAVRRACKEAEPAGRLDALIDAHVQAALADRDLHTTMLVEMRALAPERRSLVLARRDEYEKFVESVVRAGQRANRVRGDISSRYLTLALLNLLNWTIFWFDPKGDRSAAQIAEILRSVYVDGTRI